jgi:SAM-dependent methyltransferase
MVEQARKRRDDACDDLRARVEFELGDVRSYRAKRQFDAVVSLFHVMSYQTTNADQAAAFRTAREHLASGGVLVFDFWYGPAVLSDRPRESSKRVADDRLEVCRYTRPSMDINANCVDVTFEMEIASRLDARLKRITERHRMRYLFLPEIMERLEANRFEFVSAYSWLTRALLSDRSWYGCVVARAC